MDEARGAARAGRTSRKVFPLSVPLLHRRGPRSHSHGLLSVGNAFERSAEGVVVVVVLMVLMEVDDDGDECRPRRRKTGVCTITVDR